MTAEFLWQERAKPTRGPKPALTLERIADVAIAVADAEGLAAVTMQRVAADLGYTKMSLYRYLPGKAELVAAMIERAIGEPPRLRAEEGWRSGLTRWAQALLKSMDGHAWAQEATTGSRPIGPNELGWTEQALRVLPEALSGAERMDTVATVAGHVRMIAGQNVQSAPEASLLRAMSEHADRFPAVANPMDDLVPQQVWEDGFAFGLERILDGLDMLIRSRG